MALMSNHFLNTHNQLPSGILTSILYIFGQWKLWRNCVNVKVRLGLCCSPMRLTTPGYRTQISYAIGVSKIDENRCKQTLASLPCFWTYRQSQFTVIMNLPQNTAYAHGSEYIKKYRIALLLCIFETSAPINVLFKLNK